MLAVLRLGSRGDDVVRLQNALAAAGFRPGKIDGQLGHGTLAAIVGFQRSRGLLADGIVGPYTWQALGFREGFPDVSNAVSDMITSYSVAEMFPFTRIDLIEQNLPSIKKALADFSLMEKPMVLVAFATIRAETESFEPVNEQPSRFNTSPGGHLFDLYDFRSDLGNQGAPDGERYRGRGFVQLTGKANYTALGKNIGLGDQLIREPECCNEPHIAATILAAFLSARRNAIKQAMIDGDWRRARRLINGGSHGLGRFVDAITIGNRIFDDPIWPAECLDLNAKVQSASGLYQ